MNNSFNSNQRHPKKSAMINPRFYIALFLILLSIQSCTTTLQQSFHKSVARPEQAESFFTELDNTLKKNKIQNVVYAKIQDFPYLRTDRFLTEIKSRLFSDPMQQDWVAYLKTRDLEARKSEVFALPQKELDYLFKKLKLNGPVTHADLMEYVRQYSQILYQHDRNRPGYIDVLIDSVEVPDDYSTLMRAFGLYPLAYLPVAYFSNKAFDKMKKWHQLPLEAFSNQGKLISYQVDPIQANQAFEISDLLKKSNLNSFGLPRLTAADEKDLANAFAPVIMQDTTASYDKIGTFEWKGTQPKLNLEHPSVYFYLTYGLLNDDAVIQINYAFWYKARDGNTAPWFEKGEFDGLTIRVSLDRSGSPFMVDIMNNCGCYHFFVPGNSRVEKAKELDFELDPLVPKWLPESFPKKALTVRVNSGWHQIDHLTAATPDNQSVNYTLVPYQDLESLETVHGSTQNIFDKEGIMKGSYRIEPYIFFSMGIPKVGYMRQRGHHPIKMIGRDHFDNPQLFNRNFTFKKNSDKK